MWIWPNINYYTKSQNCIGEPSSVQPLSTACLATAISSTDDQNIDFGAFSIYSFDTGGNNNNDDTYSAVGGVGGLVGIILGGVAGVVLLIGLIVYCQFYRESNNKKDSQREEKENTALHTPLVYEEHRDQQNEKFLHP
jgi:hypothetical protein